MIEYDEDQITIIFKYHDMYKVLYTENNNNCLRVIRKRFYYKTKKI